MDSWFSSLVFFMGTETCDPAMVSYSCLFIQVCVFFESLAECSFGFNYVCVADVDVTRDVIDGSTLVFFWCFFLPIEQRMFAGLLYMCMLCDL